MTVVEIILLAFGLAMDAFAVSVSLGTTDFLSNRRARFRISFHFGLFQFLMPIVGWLGGVKIAPFIEAFAHWIALFLLTIIGQKMIRESRSIKQHGFRLDPSRGWNMVMLSIATSIDALAVGFSLAVINVDIWYPTILIGVITGGLSLLGVLLGNRIGVKFGKQVELAGGIMLILIGIRIVLVHLML